MRISITIEGNAKQADDVAEVLVDYLIHVEGITVLNYAVEKD